MDRAGAWLALRGASANALSLTGLAIGLSTVPLLAFGHHGPALAAILLNRLFDGLDGAVARHRRPTAFGGYLDILCDMVFYAAIPLGFGLAQPANAIWAALLLASFVCTCASFLGRAVLAAGRGEPDTGARGAKSFFHGAGLMEGTETILAFVLFCLLPGLFPWLAGGVAAMCFWTAAARVVETWISESDS